MRRRRSNRALRPPHNQPPLPHPGIGWSGAQQYAFFLEAVAKISSCRTDNPVTGNLTCTLNEVGIPILEGRLPVNAAALASKRVSIWACQVNPLATTIENSVAVGTSAWTDNADLLANVRVSDMIPCFTNGTFYSVFRGAPYIDGGYCADFAQLCAKAPSKCLKLSTTFMGPNLRGTLPPTSDNCKALSAPNYLPYPGKPYYVPADRSSWTLPQFGCADPAAKEAAKATTTPFVVQGVTAKPDIYPAFYAPLPSVFASGCTWLEAASKPDLVSDELDQMYQHGYASGLGWADKHGYCA